MPKALVTLEFVDPTGVAMWTAQLDGAPLSPLGDKKSFFVGTGVEHSIYMTFTGAPGGTIDVKLSRKSKTIEERKPEKIPLGATSTFDEFIFTIEE